MEASFIVTIKGDWMYNGKKATKKVVEKDLREAVKDHFEFLAKSVAVEPLKENGND